MDHLQTTDQATVPTPEYEFMILPHNLISILLLYLMFRRLHFHILHNQTMQLTVDLLYQCPNLMHYQSFERSTPFSSSVSSTFPSFLPSPLDGHIHMISFLVYVNVLVAGSRHYCLSV